MVVYRLQCVAGFVAQTRIDVPLAEYSLRVLRENCSAWTAPLWPAAQCTMLQLAFCPVTICPGNQTSVRGLDLLRHDTANGCCNHKQKVSRQSLAGVSMKWALTAQVSWRLNQGRRYAQSVECSCSVAAQGSVRTWHGNASGEL